MTSWLISFLLILSKCAVLGQHKNLEVRYASLQQDIFRNLYNTFIKFIICQLMTASKFTEVWYHIVLLLSSVWRFWEIFDENGIQNNNLDLIDNTAKAGVVLTCKVKGSRIRNLGVQGSGRYPILNQIWKIKGFKLLKLLRIMDPGTL